MNRNTFYGIKLISEVGDLEAHPINSTPYNTVVMDEYGYVELLDNGRMLNWEKVFFFSNNETAKHFRDKWNINRDGINGNKFHDYRDAMLLDDYYFYIINVKFPKPEELYADKIRMSKDYEPIRF